MTQNHADEPIGRRDALKKAAVAGAAAGVVWSAPKVQGLTLRPNYAAAGTGDLVVVIPGIGGTGGNLTGGCTGTWLMARNGFDINFDFSINGVDSHNLSGATLATYNPANLDGTLTSPATTGTLLTLSYNCA